MNSSSMSFSTSSSSAPPTPPSPSPPSPSPRALAPSPSPLSPHPPSPSPSPTAALSFPPIEERVEEEERAAEETARCPPSPLAHYYSGLTLSDRYAWPAFLGDWAWEESGQPRRVSTGCMDEEHQWRGDPEVDQHHVQGKHYAKDDLSVPTPTPPHHPLPPPPPPSFLLHHVTVRKRNSVCDIEFHFPHLPPSSSSSESPGFLYYRDSGTTQNRRLERPRDLPISPIIASATPSVSVLTSQSSIAPTEWEVVAARRHSNVHVRDPEWVLFLCFFVFVSLWCELSVHHFVLVLLALQAMYFLLLSFV